MGRSFLEFRRRAIQYAASTSISSESSSGPRLFPQSQNAKAKLFLTFWEDLMRFNSLALVSSFFLSGLLLACGGGGNPPPVTPLSITTTSLPSGQTAVAYNTTLGATGGNAPYSWSVKSGALPAGLSLSTAGAVTGTPTTAGAANVTVQVSDSAMTPQTAASGSLTLAISGGTLKITSTTAAVGTVGTAYNFQLTATGG